MSKIEIKTVTSSGIKAATFLLVALFLKQLRYRTPRLISSA
jgi:hypothetical protein